MLKHRLTELYSDKKIINLLKKIIMKATLSIAISLLMAFFSSGQNETLISQRNISEIKVTPPEFSGSTVTIEKSLIKNYLAENFRTPQINNAQGTEVVQFTVTSNGNVTDFKIINSVSRAIDQEMIRVLKTTNGMWKPGFNNEHPVDMTQEVSIAFYNDEQAQEAEKLFVKWATSSFNKGGSALFEQHNINKALKCFNEGLNYLPYNKSLYCCGEYAIMNWVTGKAQLKTGTVCRA